eukprot:CAMPEP_0177619366 /NCGR_PEP_ID=MMETSP0419_2-20121207/26207_1 /TAXON_ID=582737 /ORGANISM="Tetraselmis sp., Strain GSL018" /LENGTH=169 /DNA_ID=CAMNT_0019118599 /DNA_START=866 /DNA_END=1375 /DNA_ORIENTATION=-
MRTRTVQNEGEPLCNGSQMRDATFRTIGLPQIIPPLGHGAGAKPCQTRGQTWDAPLRSSNVTNPKPLSARALTTGAIVSNHCRRSIFVVPGGRSPTKRVLPSGFLPGLLSAPSGRRALLGGLPRSSSSPSGPGLASTGGLLRLGRLSEGRLSAAPVAACAWADPHGWLA